MSLSKVAFASRRPLYILNSYRFIGFPPAELTAGNPGAHLDLEALLGQNLAASLAI